jgi:CHAT domain-containing protein
LGLLTTEDATLAPDPPGQPLFAGYRSAPWLIRQVAVAQLPSVTSLTTLRTMPAPAGQRRPFIGFGDPWFNPQEAAEAQAEQADASPGGATTMAMRNAPLRLRSVPRTENAASAGLGDLPRLPETAAEVTAAARALQADPVTDVYLGARASEQMVETLKLDDRRIVMFATHGLVPGDLDGLTEPALALSAPAVTGMQGDGLLTVGKIFGLRLDADWVVLSACNTAAGNGAGADAVSGLGLAFFYAGTRALLVSNWPVETTSARALTGELFRREAANPGLGRAEALRQAMTALMDSPGFIDPRNGQPLFSYAHPIFWAPFSLVGDAGGD